MADPELEKSRENPAARPRKCVCKTKNIEETHVMNAENELAIPGGRKRKKYEWSVIEVEGTRVKLKKRRVFAFGSKDLAVFYQLLQDPIIKKFLQIDVKFYTSRKNLLAIVVEYFGHLGSLQEPYNSIHFFLLLYAVCQMDQQTLSDKWLSIPLLLGNTWIEEGFKKFWPVDAEFLKNMDWKTWVSREILDIVTIEGRLLQRFK